ncbi:uncharacterized protein LOC130736681 [Lotus japonicus]|uniref:uncharacterized protein LOC130736681 n=1 Tax=Lotus japonicus TaxID=34305 RepID=UPI002583B853|nr:uncharacterized protein LOC130736681 [Lotus japonicus]
MKINSPLLACLAVFCFLGVCQGGSLRKQFYRKSCSQAEQIVKTTIQQHVSSRPELPAKLLRMHFHDCFVRGCDGSVLLNSTAGNTAEKDAIPNLSLSGFDVIDEIKEALEAKCPKIVSCADILALAARDAVSVQFNNEPKWEVLTGRRDGTVSKSSEVLTNIPAPFFTFTQLKQSFESKKLTLHDMVVLSGGHTIGVGHCNLFSNRLYNFTGKGDQDPSLNPTYAEFLKTKCKSLSDTTTTVDMDPNSGTTFDSNYYSILLQNKGMFQSDAALLATKQSKKIVNELVGQNKFFTEFGQSMKRMGAIEVLSGTAGEIRTKCSVVNSHSAEKKQHKYSNMKINSPLLACLAVFCFLGVCQGGSLRKQFYRKSCSQAEQIVKTTIQQHVSSRPELPAKLLRMHFHDCFVRGCDGSVLLNSTAGNTAEKDAIPNLSLSGFDVIDEIKEALEAKCPKIVSCADILALAARDAVSVQFNNEPKWEVLTGRRDGTVSKSSEVLTNIPAPFFTFTQLKQSFESKKLTLHDMVVLSGGHTIGVGHCNLFSNRLYNFTGKGDQDPSLNPTYAEFLKTKCKSLSDTTTTVDMDPNSGTTFDSNYYSILLQNKGMFQSDAALLATKQSKKIVNELVGQNKFFTEFGQSMKRMGAIEVLSGTAGEIRTKCSVVNS